MKLEMYKNLFKIQQSLKVGKTKFNKHGNFNYRNLSDILEVLKPLLAEMQLVLFFEDSIKEIGNRFYIQSKAILLDINTGDCIEHTGLCREPDSQSGIGVGQLTGATSSYSKKYLLLNWFLLDDSENDLDGNEIQERAEKEKQEKEKQEKVKKDDDEKRKIVTSSIFELSGKNVEMSTQILKALTSFKSKDGKEVEGLTESKKLNGQRLNVLYGKIKKINEMTKEQQIKTINEILGGVET